MSVKHGRSGRAVKVPGGWQAQTLCGAAVWVTETSKRRGGVTCRACGDEVDRLMGFPVRARESAPVAAPAGGEGR